MAQAMERTKAHCNEKVAILEKALQEATEKQQATQQAREARDEEQRQSQSRNERLEAERTELRQMVADLRLAKEDLEQENMRLHAQDLAREDTLRQFFEQAAPALARLGRPLRLSPAEAASSVDAPHFAQVAAALADSLNARGAGAELPGAALAAEEAGLLGEAVWQAVEGGEPAFEDWFSRQLDAAARTRLAKASRLLSGCRQVASLRSTIATTPSGVEEDTLPITGSMYVPVKTDPVDLLVASSLLRLATDPAAAAAAASAAAGLLRLEPGKYRLGPDGAMFDCYMDSGQVMAQTLNHGNKDSLSSPIELSEFLAKGSIAREGFVEIQS